VDFIIETENEFLFIEIKDPENPLARNVGTEKLNELKEPALLSRKLKDTLLKELAKGNHFHKPVKFIYILEWSGFDAAQRRKTYEDINSVIPRFKESDFHAIRGICFSIFFSIRDFQQKFNFPIQELNP
jgi:hypothetical protein